MKHAVSVMLLAGMAGGAVWYRTDHDASASFQKLQIPDPGPEEEVLAAGPVPSPDKLDIELMEPVDELPQDAIAQRSAEVFTVSDEQPFAVSDDSSDDEDGGRANEPQAGPFRPIEAEPKSEEPSSRGADRTADRRDLSVEGRPIGVRRIGQGAFHTVIIAGVDGRDLTAVEWADDLADALERRSDLLEQHEFLIVRAANPDGLAAKSRGNARGVDLNRNFPTRRYRRSDDSGVGPASEPETRLLLQTLSDSRPQRVVHLCSTSGKSGVYFNQAAGDVAERLQRQFGLPAERLNLDQLPGSLEEFSDATWNSSIVRLHLRGLPEQDIPRKLIPLLVSAVSARDASSRPVNVGPVSTPYRTPSRWQSAPTSSPVPLRPMYETQRRARPVIRRGYEELPPPPQ